MIHTNMRYLNFLPNNLSDHLFPKITRSHGPLPFYMYHFNTTKVFPFLKKKMFLSNNFCTSLTFEAKGLVRKHQAKFLLYLPFCLSPGRWEVQTVTTSNSSCTFGGKQSVLKYVGNQLPGMCRSLFLRLSCLVWLIFLSPGHMFRISALATHRRRQSRAQV